MLAGLAFAYLVLGPRVLDVTDISWMTGDSSASYLGWLFFRGEPQIGVPLGFSSKLGFPLGEPIAYLDSMPIVAMLFWPFGNLLPAIFQYHSIVFVSHCCLQCYFGCRICLRLNGRAHASAFVGGLLFMIAPAFIWRMLGHIALSSHWLLLVAIELYLASRTGISRRWKVACVALCVVAGGINPYLAFMALLVLVTALLSAACFPRHHPGVPLFGAAVLLGLFSVVTLGSLTLFGFIRPGDTGSYAGDGYGMYSMNLLAPLDPMEFPALLLKQQATNPGQYEGYNYLGLGLLALAVVSIARQPTVLNLLRNSRVFPILFVACLSLVLALSTKATFGTFTLYDLKLPNSLSAVLSSLRASGRLFWTAYYLIITGIMAAAFVVFRQRSFAGLIVVLGIQLLDGYGLAKAIRTQWDTSSARTFTDEEVWQAAARSHKHIVVVPPWQCDPKATPGGENGYWIFGKLAGKHGMTLNSFYAGRTSPRQIHYFCNVQPRELTQEGLKDNTLYVFPNVASITSLSMPSHQCQRLNGVVACQYAPARAGIESSLQNELPIALGAISFDAASPGSSNVLGLGWGGQENWGRWSNSQAATLAFRVADPARSLDTEITVIAFTPGGRRQRLAVVADRRVLGEWSFTSEQETTLRFNIPQEAIQPNGFVTLHLELPDAQSPTSLGLWFDSRQLGVGLKRLRFTPR